MDKSLYSKYILEREGKEIIERTYSFATYSIGIKDDKPTFYLHDVFVEKQYRNTNEMQFLFSKLYNEAVERKCEVLMCAVSTKDGNLSKNVYIFHKYKFKYLPEMSQNSELLYFSQLLTPKTDVKRDKEIIIKEMKAIKDSCEKVYQGSDIAACLDYRRYYTLKRELDNEY